MAMYPDPDTNPEDYNAFVESLIDFIKAKEEDMIRKGYTPTLEQLLIELEDTKRPL